MTTAAIPHRATRESPSFLGPRVVDPVSLEQCPEHKSLKEALDIASRALQLHRSMIADGTIKGTEVRRLRQSLIKARRDAISLLYDHSLTCPICRRSQGHTA